MTRARPTLSRRTQALVTWVAIYPAITAVLWLSEPLGLLKTPLPLRTLVLTTVLVPTTVFVLVPAVTGALRTLVRWQSHR